MADKSLIIAAALFNFIIEFMQCIFDSIVCGAGLSLRGAFYHLIKEGLIEAFAKDFKAGTYFPHPGGDSGLHIYAKWLDKPVEVEAPPVAEEVAIEPKVEEIKSTQYRVASDSAVVNALLNAKNNGKRVTVFVELKARFDEYANLQFAKIMSKAGIKIIYSIPGLKVHAKVALVLKKPVNNKQVAYAFLSTGNFNEKTARIYADHGLFTTNENITSELKDFFCFLEVQDVKPKLKHLLVAQLNIKKELTRMIDREISHAAAGRKARMILKMNGLDHPKMIGKLYEAGRNGVEIDLLVRGICCLVPGKKFSENIRVTRIVDRFLEHARVFVFHNGGNPEIYMSSADWMNRNLERRIELVFPVYDEDIKKEVLEILDLQLKDNTKARILDSEHKNLPKPAEEGRQFRAQIETYNYLKDQSGSNPG